MIEITINCSAIIGFIKEQAIPLTNVLVTAVYSFFTYKIMQSNKSVVDEMRRQSRPIIAINPYIRRHSVALFLEIKNIGKSTAEDLKLELSVDFFFRDGKSSKMQLKRIACL